MNDTQVTAELAFVDSIWPKIKGTIDASIFALDTSSPGVEGALKTAADVALTCWRRAQAVSLPDRETLIEAAKDAWGNQWIDRHGEQHFVPPVSDNGATIQCITSTVDAVLAALSTQPAAGDGECSHPYSRIKFDGGARAVVCDSCSRIVSHLGADS